MSSVRLGAVQMVSGPDLAANLEAAARLVGQAARLGAGLVGLPENFYLVSSDERAKVLLAEEEGRGPIQDFLAALARAHRLWLIGGTCPLRGRDAGRIRSACLAYDPEGRCVARYDKMHLFRFDGGGGERYDEARTVEPGERPVAFEAPFGRVALSVCYDVRFPELYRALAPVDLICVPSAFTVPTGRAHWEVLLRARAIENLAWVLAPAQGGLHATGRRTWGHSLIVGPWGEVLAERSDEGEGVVVAEMDLERFAEVRQSLPALEHRRL